LTEHLIALDHLLRAWVVTHRSPVLNGAMSALSLVGQAGLVWFLIGGGLTAWRRLAWRDFARLVLAVLIASLVVDGVLKPVFQRVRPYGGTPEIPVIGRLPITASFPSGHSANSFASAFVLSRLAPAGRVFWWLLAVAIAFSRVYLGVHYPLDVIAGGLIGVACAALALRVTRRYAADARLRPRG
jgi:undecaprenyl-diphosphatase